MKNFIIAVFLFIGIGVSAQKINSTDWLYTYTGVAADTIGGTQTTWYKDVEFSSGYLNTVAFTLKLSDRAAGCTATIALQAKSFGTDSYTPIYSFTWAGGGTDTTVTFNSNSTKYGYNYYRVLVTRTASKGTINNLRLFVKR
jgi:hypothetical protein